MLRPLVPNLQGKNMRTFKAICVAVGIFAAWFAGWHLLDRALAVQPQGQRGYYMTVTPVTVGASSAQAIGPDPARSYMIMCNEATAATTIVYWTPVQNGAATVAGAGSFPIGASACVTFDSTILRDGINMISNVASTPASIGVID
jgi:hypothetical protein